MSESSEGAGWWQASDDRWYPPDQHPDARRVVDEAAARARTAAEASVAVQGTAPVAPTTPAPVSPSPVPVSGTPVAATASGSGSNKTWRVLIVLLVVLAIGGAVVATTGGGGNDAVVTDTIDIRGDVRNLAVSEDAVWVTSLTSNGVLDAIGWLSRIDLDSRTVTDTIEVGGRAVAVSNDAVWVTDEPGETVSRVDLDTRTVTDTINIDGNPSALAVSDDAVWVASNTIPAEVPFGDPIDRPTDTVQRIDLETLVVTDTIEVGDSPSEMTISGDAVWVAGGGSGSVDDPWVSRIDLDTMTVTDTIDIDGSPYGMAASADAVWVVSREALTVRIDVDTMTITDSVSAGGAVAVSSDSIWVSRTNLPFDYIERIDLDSLTDTELIEVGSPGAIAVADDAVWVVDDSRDSVSRVG